MNRNIPKNYSFVRFPEKPNVRYISSLKERMGAQDDSYTGYLDLEITTVDYLHIGSGFSHLDHKKLISEVARENQSLIIPGSSLKGAVRQICRAISDGCIPKEREIKLQSRQRAQCDLQKETFHCCIVCDMFGGMSLGSKIRFTDLTAQKNNVECIPVCVQFSPNAKASSYQYNCADNRKYHIGYKFYYTYCDKAGGATEEIEVVSKNVPFMGRVYFKQFRLEELCLFMHALGFYQNFSLKLGGYKNAGLGTVRTKCCKFVVNGKVENPEKAYDYAKQYYDNCTDEAYAHIRDLETIMEYKER